jgi:hypothetical protein
LLLFIFRLKNVQFSTLLSTALSPLAPNGVAAWRSGGFTALLAGCELPKSHKSFCGIQPPLRQTVCCRLPFGFYSLYSVNLLFFVILFYFIL